MKTAADILAMLATKPPEKEGEVRSELMAVLGKIAGATSHTLPGAVTAMALMDVAVVVARIDGCDDSALLAMFEAAKHTECQVSAEAFAPGVSS